MMDRPTIVQLYADEVKPTGANHCQPPVHASPRKDDHTTRRFCEKPVADFAVHLHLGYIKRKIETRCFRQQRVCHWGQKVIISPHPMKAYRILDLVKGGATRSVGEVRVATPQIGAVGSNLYEIGGCALREHIPHRRSGVQYRNTGTKSESSTPTKE